jgi:hypothetical protein
MDSNGAGRHDSDLPLKCSPEIMLYAGRPIRQQEVFAACCFVVPNFRFRILMA